MSASLSGARQGRPNFMGRLVARAQARELHALVVPGPEAARAVGVDLEATGLRISDTPRHANVLVLVGELPPGLKNAAAIAYAQMPRPRGILSVRARDVSPLPEPDAAVEPGQENVAAGVAELRRLFAQGAFSPEAADFDVDAIRTQTEYVCPMHPEVVRSEPGSCPICGMDLVPREAAGGNGHDMHHEGMDHGAYEGDHGSHGGMDHGEAEHPAAARGGAREEGQNEGHEATGHDRGGHGKQGASHGEHDYADHGNTEHASADEEDAEAGSDDHEEHDNHAGMEHGEQDEGHEQMTHGGADESEGQSGHEGMDHGGMDHGDMDHGDMGFMSMVEMTQGTPRSSDGLQMEWVEDASFGPLFPGLPGGLALTLTLDGDTVARAEAEGIVGRPSVEELAGPARVLADRLARLDPLSPVAYRVLVSRALESAAGVEPDERTALARVGALEKDRASSHLGWLSIFGRLIGYPWLESRAGKLQLALVRTADADGIARLWVEVGRLSRRVQKTPLLRRKLGRVGLLPEGAQTSGPVARARGIAADARSHDGVYRSLGFEPIVRGGDDALSRLAVRLAEIEQSLDLIQKVGKMALSEPATNDTPLREGSATVETPRGTATLRLAPEDGTLSVVELDEPSARHLGLVGAVAEQRELADALVGVASLDLSPWGMAR